MSETRSRPEPGNTHWATRRSQPARQTIAATKQTGAASLSQFSHARLSHLRCASRNLLNFSRLSYVVCTVCTVPPLLVIYISLCFVVSFCAYKTLYMHVKSGQCATMRLSCSCPDIQTSTNPHARGAARTTVRNVQVCSALRLCAGYKWKEQAAEASSSRPWLCRLQLYNILTLPKTPKYKFKNCPITLSFLILTPAGPKLVFYTPITFLLFSTCLVNTYTERPPSRIFLNKM